MNQDQTVEKNKVWIKWTFAEAITRTTTKIVQKLIGATSSALPHVVFAAFIVGLVRVIIGFVGARIRRIKLLASKKEIIGSCTFGLNASIAAILSFYIFTIGGDVGINTFIMTLTIVPGAFIDSIFFNHKLVMRQWFGVLIAVFAGYIVLGQPSLAELTRLPLWIWLSLIVMLVVSINQGITQAIKKVDPMVKNFWGGIVEVIIALSVLFVVGSLTLFAEFSLPIQKLILLGIISGTISVALWSFNLISYKRGALIAIKKLVMNGSYLTMAIIVGVIFFGEVFSSTKILGILSFLVAFTLMDNTTWNAIKKMAKKKSAI